MEYANLPPNGTALQPFSSAGQSLQGWQDNSGGSQAVMYMLRFPLGFLSNFNNYGSISKLYDYVRLNFVDINLRSRVDPTKNTVVGAQNSTSYNYEVMPQNDPILMWPEYDGWQPQINVGDGSPIPSPPNGDVTQQYNNKDGCRRFHPFRNIRYRFYPKTLNMVATEGSTGPSTTAAFVQGGRTGWVTVGTSPVFNGYVGIAFPYIGQPVGGFVNVNEQPHWSFSIANRWSVSFKCPLYG